MAYRAAGFTISAHSTARSVWPGCAGAEGEAGRAEPFGSNQRAPTADIEAEHRRHHHRVARAHAGGPENARVGFPDAIPVAAADAEHGGSAGGARRAVDAVHLIRRNAEETAVGRVSFLLHPDFFLGEDGQLRELFQATDVRRVYGGVAPELLIETGLLPGIPDLAAQFLKDHLVTRGEIHGLHLGVPMLRVPTGDVLRDRMWGGQVMAIPLTDRRG